MTRLRSSLPELGYSTMTFDFSGVDRSEGDFSTKLMSKELQDIRAAIDYIEKHHHPKHIVLLGHSTGANDAALYAHTDERLSALILLAGVSKLDEATHYDFSDRMVKDFWEKGCVTYIGGKDWFDGKTLHKAFYDEFFTLDIPAALQQWEKPTLIVHGEKDEAIPMNKDPLELYAMANNPKELAIIPHAGHKFEGDTWPLMLEKVDEFLRRQIQKSLQLVSPT